MKLSLWLSPKTSWWVRRNQFKQAFYPLWENHEARLPFGWSVSLDLRRVNIGERRWNVRRANDLNVVTPKLGKAGFVIDAGRATFAVYRTFSWRDDSVGSAGKRGRDA